MLRAISNVEGIAGWYKGNWATIVRIVPYAAVQFTVFERMKLDNKTALSPPYLLLAGGTAGAAAVLCTYPLDLIRARIAAQVFEQHYQGVAHALRHMVRTEGGVRALFQGIRPTLIGIIPYAGMNFTTYEYLKRLYRHQFGEQPAFMAKALCGGLAGAVGQTVAYPWDVVRRRMQLERFHEGKHLTTQPSSFGTMRHIVQREGPMALLRGISLNYVKVVPMVAISFSVYEYVAQQLKSM